MDKIKNLLSPGKDKDDEILYGSGNTAGNTTHKGGLSGEGSHFDNTRDTSTGATSNTLGPTGSHPTGTSGLGNTSITSQSGHGLGHGSHLGSTNPTSTSTHAGGLSGEGSHLASATGASSGFTGFHSSQSAGTSGLGNTQTSGISSGTTAGPHTSNIANKVDPRIDSDRDASRTLGTAGNTQHSSGAGSSNLTPGLDIPGAWIDEDSSRGVGHTGAEGTNPSYPINSGTQNTSISSGGHLGRDAAAVGTAGALGSAASRHGQNDPALASNTGYPINTGYTGIQDTPGQGASSTSGSNYPAQSGQTVGNQVVPSTTGSHANFPSTTGQTSTQGATSGSGQHLGRDAAALGTAGVVGAGIQQHHRNERGVGSSPAYTGVGPTSSYHTGPTGTGVSQGPHNTGTANLLDPSVNPRGPGLEDAHHHSPKHGGGAEEADHHHAGRNTAFGAGAGAGALGLAAHEHNKHQTDRSAGTTGTSGVGEAAIGSTTTYSRHQLPTHGPGSELDRGAHQTSSGLGSTTGASTSANDPTSFSHHYGRDAAIGTSGVGAAGLADQHQGAHQASTGTGIGNTSGTSTTTDPTSSGHHYGRDAAIGAGGVGAAGLAAHEYQKHQNDKTTGIGSSTTTTTTSTSSGSAPNTTGPHSKDWMNKLDPRVVDNPTDHQNRPNAHAATIGPYDSTSSSTRNPAQTERDTTTGFKDHHYGRDAAVAGGVGAAGVGAYEAGKHHGDKNAPLNNPDPIGNPGAAPITRNTQPGRDATAGYSATGSQNVAHKADPTTDSERFKEHHYGRDAAVGAGVGAGVGAAAYETDKHRQEKDLKHAQKEAEKEHKKDVKHAEKEAEKDHKKAVKEHEKEAKKEAKHDEKEHKKGGLFSFLHRDKSKKYSAEEEAEFDRQEREHNASQSHAGRNTALGAAGVGAVGVGAYEADKHHSQPGTDGTRHLGTTHDSNLTRTSGHGSGATTGSTLEHDKHSGHGPTPLPEKPLGKDIGDHLHGVDRNRGVVGDSGFPGSSGFGSGDSHPGSAVRSEASTDQHGNPVVSTGGHHHGRDAALGAGAGLGAAGLASGHQKHDSGYQGGLGDKTSPTAGQYVGTQQSFGLGSSSTAGQYGTQHQTSGLGSSTTAGQYPSQQQTSGLSGSNTTGKYGTQHQTSGLGSPTTSGQYGSSNNPTSNNQYSSNPTASGLTGSHEQSHFSNPLSSSHSTTDNEYRKHETSTYPTSSTTNPTSSSSNYPSSTDQHSNLTTGESHGRNRLHKDPPANHPAAKAYSGTERTGEGVPSSKAERERMISEGGDGIDKDSGVANARRGIGEGY